MKTTGKIIVAGLVGTTLMTLYSYYISKKEKEQYREPELLNALVDRSRYLPQIADKQKHPFGWAAHYGIGIMFVIAYRLLWKESLKNPSLFRTAVIGAASGGIGIVSWKFFFSEHDNPPANDRQGYYRQLFYAHIIFSASAIITYRLLSGLELTKNTNEKF